MASRAERRRNCVAASTGASEPFVTSCSDTGISYPLELVTRVALNVRPDLLDFPPFRLDLRREELSRGQEVVRLKPKVYALLRYLAERPQQLILKSDLLNALWGDVHVGEAVLKAHLNQVRRALSDSVRRPTFVETVHRRGYRFIAPVRTVFSQQDNLAEAPPPGPPSILVGRDRELQAMLAAWTENADRHQRVLFLTGEAGIGKTSLLRAFAEKVMGQSEVLIAYGHCIEHGSGEPYLPIFEAFGRACRRADGARCLSLLKQCAPNWLAQMPELIEQKGESPLPIGATADRLLREIGNGILVLSQAAPLLLILEDLHWADYSTIGLIEFLATMPDPASVLIVGTYRPQELTLSNHPLRGLRQRLDVHDRCRCVELEYLTRNDVEEYLAARFERHQLPVRFAHEVHGHTSGNPLFLVRVLDDWVKEGVIRERAGTWQLARDVETMSINVPDGVVALIERDVDRLDSLERLVLEAASIVGDDFDATTLAAALDRQAAPIDDICMKWCKQGRFIRVRRDEVRSDVGAPPRYGFLHALYQHIVYDRIGLIRRSYLHRRTGEQLEDASSNVQPSAATLARHFEQGNDPSRAVKYRQSAAGQAMRRGAYPEAIDHYQAALALVERLPPAPESKSVELDLWLGVGAPLAMTRGYTASETERAYLNSSRLASTLRDRSRAMVALAGAATCHFVHGAYELAQHAGEELLGTARGEGDLGAELYSHLVIGVSSFYQGELLEAKRHLSRGVELYDRERHAELAFAYRQDPWVTGQCFLALTLWHLGEEGLAVAMADQARSFANELNDSFSVTCSISYSLLLHHSRRDFGRCERLARELLELASDRRFAFYVEGARLVLGAVAVEHGDVADGLSQLRSARQKRHAAGAGINRSFWATTLVEACMKAGLLQEAARVLAEAFEAVTTQREFFWQPEVYRLAGELIARGAELGEWMGGKQPVTAAGAFEVAIETARAMGSVALERRAAMSCEACLGLVLDRGIKGAVPRISRAPGPVEWVAKER
jgi:DNA-binding winged helix-turn-helix (wHTH) protein/tetratricopeptide (TPR) repeat protein